MHTNWKLATVLLLPTAAIAQVTWTQTYNNAGPPPYQNTWEYPQCINGTCIFYIGFDGSSGIYSNALYSYTQNSSCTGGLAGANSACMKLINWIGTSGTCPPGGAGGGPPSTATWPSNRHPTGMFADHVRNKLFSGWGVCGGFTAADWWSFAVNGPPLTTTTWTQLSPPKNLPIWGGSTNLNGSNVVHDTVDDCYIMFGQDGNGTGRTQIYCPTDRNPMPGTLTAAQTAAGATAPDAWNCLIGLSGTSGGSGSGGSCTSSGATQPVAVNCLPLLQYDRIHNKILLFGGSSDCSSGTQSNEMWVYDPPTQAWGKISNAGASGVPPASMSCTGGGCSMPTAIVGNGHSLYYHQNSGPADWVGEYTSGSPGTMSWTQVSTGGPTDAQEMTFDSTRNVLLTFAPVPASVSFNIWEGKIPSNTITFTNVGTTTSNYPVQIGRAFVQGEIPNGSLPQAFINGSGITTQVDVKNRWSDLSLKYAILSFMIPTATNNTPVTVSFASGSTAGNTALTKTQMLDSSYNFDAQIQMTRSATTRTASARTMLNATSSIPTCETIDWTTSAGVSACYWVSGPVATTVLIANHANSTTCNGNASSTYDFTNFADSNCSIRPMFWATFWPTTHQVKIRYAAENANTESQEDVLLDSMILTIGNTSPSTAYTRSTPFTQGFASRWTRTFWLGGTPPNANLDNNIQYLATTKAISNFDGSKSVSASTISTAYTTNWLGSGSACSSGTAAGTDIYAAGEYNASGVCGDLTQGGGHDWIGSMASWTNRWLYSGDYRMAAETLGNADLLGAWPIHFREGKSTNFINQAGTTHGLGRVMSISSRPLLRWAGNPGTFSGSVGSFIGGNSANSSVITATGNYSANNFNQDPAHMPQVYIEYLLTGDEYYLEESQFWSGWAAWYYEQDPGTYVFRGPTGAEGGLPDQNGQIYQLRGQGWAFLARSELAFIAPDSQPEHAYFDQLVKDAMGNWEGQRAITTGCCNGNAMWTYGNNAAFTVTPTTSRFWTTCGGCGDPDPTTWLSIPNLHWWDLGNKGQCDSSLVSDLTTINGCYKNWMYSYLAWSLGRAGELGYNTTALQQWVAVNFLGQLTDPGYNPWLMGTYFTQITKANSGVPSYYTSWADTRAAFAPTIANQTSFGPSDTAEGVPGQEFSGNGYSQPFGAATSYLVALSNPTAAAAWSFISTNVEPGIGANGCGSTETCDLKWAVLPRSVAAGSACSISLTQSPPGPYTQTQTGISITATAVNCGAGTLTWSSSTLPTGMSGCNSVTGPSCAVTGTPSASGTFAASISVTDGGANSASTSPSIVINPAPSISTSCPLPQGSQNIPYSTTLAGTGGTPPVVWSVTAGALPTGLTLNSSTGAITGTPTTGQTTMPTFHFTDTNSIFASLGPCSITIVIGGVSGGTLTGTTSLVGNTVLK